MKSETRVIPAIDASNIDVVQEFILYLLSIKSKYKLQFYDSMINWIDANKDDKYKHNDKFSFMTDYVLFGFNDKLYEGVRIATTGIKASKNFPSKFDVVSLMYDLIKLRDKH